METITVLHNQSLLDIAIQYTGIVENSFKIAVFNDIAVSDYLLSGMTLEIPDNIEKDFDVINYYLLHDLQPATGITNTSIIPTGKGIGSMQIANSFKVS